MVFLIDISLPWTDLALSWCQVVYFRICKGAGLTCECLTNNFLLSQALLTLVSLNIVYLVDATNNTGLVSQIIQTSIGTVEADLLLIPNEGFVLWAAGEVVGDWPLKDFDLVVTFADGTIVPVEGCKVILKVAAIQIHHASGLLVYLYIAKVSIKSLVDQSEVLFGQIE